MSAVFFSIHIHVYTPQITIRFYFLSLNFALIFYFFCMLNDRCMWTFLLSLHEVKKKTIFFRLVFSRFAFNLILFAFEIIAYCLIQFNTLKTIEVGHTQSCKHYVKMYVDLNQFICLFAQEKNTEKCSMDKKEGIYVKILLHRMQASMRGNVRCQTRVEFK